MTIAVAEAGIGWVVLVGVAGVVLGAVLIWELERSPWFGEVAAGRVGADAQPRRTVQDVAVVPSPDLAAIEPVEASLS